MKRFKILFCISSIAFVFLFISAQCIANNWYDQVNFGVGLASLNQDQEVRIFNTPTPGLTNRYVSDDSFQWANYLGLAAGYNFILNNNFELGLGGEGAIVYYPNIDGKVHPEVNTSPDFDKVGYSYNGQTYLLLGTGRLLLNKGTWRPYISAGAGIGWNRMYKYREFHLDGSSGAPAKYLFESNTQSSFAYSLGLGIERDITSKTKLSFGYKYIDSGKSSLGTTPRQQTDQKLDFNAVRTHLLILGLMF